MDSFKLIGAISELKSRMRKELEKRPNLEKNEKAFGYELVKQASAIVPWKNISRDPREIPRLASEIISGYASEGGRARAAQYAQEKLTATAMTRRFAS